jgi:hypothetical protein
MPHSVEPPAFSRAANPNRATAEVRLDLPLEEVAVIDAIASQRNMSRKAVVEEACAEYARKRIGEAAVILRMAGQLSNPSSGDSES